MKIRKCMDSRPISSFNLPENFDSYFPTREETKQYIKELAEDIKKGADFPPIEIDKYGNIINGEHRIRAFKLAGKKNIPVKIVQRKIK